MELNFEVLEDLSGGKYSDTIHFPNTQAEVFYINDGVLLGLPTNKIDEGNWESIFYQEEVQVSNDALISNIELGLLSGFGIIGCYKSDDKHKMLIHEFEIEMIRFLDSGSIKYSIDTPIYSFTLSMENPKHENPDYNGNVAVSEDLSFLSPGSKVVFEFSMGDSEPYHLGTFYVDRSNFSLLGETVSVDGRNIIGKALNDQSFAENNYYGYQAIHEIINTILLQANIEADWIKVEDSSIFAGYQFDSKMSYLDGIREIFKAMDSWQIKELEDATVVVGSADFKGFTQNSTYTFYRNHDIFTRSIVRDDQESYRRVCVHNQDFSIKEYRDVETYSGWNLQANKTLYVNVPEGTSKMDAEKYADRIADSLQFVGKIESFTGPFRPQLMLGDEAVIISDAGQKSLGLITEITHRFGKDGFYTDFAVDSGGRLGKGRLSDYIGKITKDKTSSSRIYE